MENNSKPSEISWTAIIIVSLSSFIIALDSTFMNVAIGNLVVDLNTTLSAVQIIISVYALTMASLMLLGGKMQDLLGRKNAYVAGAVIFGFGTAIAALSVNSTMLLIGWSVLEGVGAALMTPATASIIVGMYSGKNREFALGIRTSIATTGAGVGPLIGGFLATFFSWRWAFGLELGIILIILALSRKLKYFPPINEIFRVRKIGSSFIFSRGLIIRAGNFKH